MAGSIDNLRAILRHANTADRREGCAAYRTYNQVIRSFAEHYGVTFERALSAFVALSPNSDYLGNLRSLASVLAAIRDGTPCSDVTVSTYNHCRDRAYSYATGESMFLAKARGLKIRSFFLNIFDPLDVEPVTVDGHIVCAWRGLDATMKESSVRPTQYRQIAGAVRRVARSLDLIPNQVQATIWITRKRRLGIKFAHQLDMFSDAMAVTPDEARPYQSARAN